MLRNNRKPQTSLKFRLSRLTGIKAFRGRLQRGAQRATLSEAETRVQWAQTFWGRKLIKSTTLALALLCSASVALADIKITTKSEASGQSMISTTYIKGTRQRTEGMGYTIIYQCDLKRMIQLNDKTRTYLITPLDKVNAQGGASSPSAGSRTRRGGVITYTTTSTDTGERKEMLGLTAKHIKSKTVIVASEGACTPMNMEMETDGWYVSLPANFNCQTDAAAPVFPMEQSECVDEYRYKTEGVVNTGYPLMTTTRMKFNTGADEPSMNIPASTSTQEVVDISKSPLDASLFEIPAGYREVKTTQELGSPY